MTVQSFALPEGAPQLRSRFEGARLREDVIAIVRATARVALNADGVTFILRDGDQCHYIEEDAIGPLWKGRRFAMDQCISGWAMLNDQSVAISDIFMDKRIPHDAYRPTFVKSLIMAPIRAEGAVAAIGAYWKERRKFTPADIGHVETIAEFAGNALRRVRTT